VPHGRRSGEPSEGHTATAGEDWMCPDLANEAMRLARMLR
jgi:predicted RNA polymerase sigma factor